MDALAGQCYILESNDANDDFLPLFLQSALMKPRFAAPPVTLEKSLKEEMERTYDESDDDESGTSGSLYAASVGLPDLPVPTGAWQENPHNLSITDEEKEKRLQESAQIGDTAEAAESSDTLTQTEAEIGQDFSLENRPFLEGIFQVMSCEENDYMALFGLCLLYAIQQNAGEWPEEIWKVYTSLTGIIGKVCLATAVLSGL